MYPSFSSWGQILSTRLGDKDDSGIGLGSTLAQGCPWIQSLATLRLTSHAPPQALDAPHAPHLHPIMTEYAPFWHTESMQQFWETSGIVCQVCVYFHISVRPIWWPSMQSILLLLSNWVWEFSHVVLAGRTISNNIYALMQWLRWIVSYTSVQIYEIEDEKESEKERWEKSS